MRRRSLVVSVLVIATLSVPASGAHAQGKAQRTIAGYPTKPVRLVAPFPPAGSSDLILRIFAQALAETYAYITPRDEFSALIRQEIGKYAKLVQAAGIRPE